MGCSIRGAAFSPLPLAGEGAERSEAGGASLGNGIRGETPTPTLPRKREREWTVR